MHPNEDTRQIAVVGGGPSGAMFAKCAAEKGAHGVQLIDGTDFKRIPQRCGGLISGSTIKRLNLEGIDFFEECLLNTINKIRYISPSRKIIERASRNCAVVVNRGADHERPIFEEVMMKAAIDKGVTVTSSRVLKINERNLGIDLTLSNNRHICADKVVGADGFESIVRGHFNESRPTSFVFLGQYLMRFNDAQIEEDELVILFGEKIAPNGYGWIIPAKVDRGEYLVGVGYYTNQTNVNLEIFLKNLLQQVGLPFEKERIIQKFARPMYLDSVQRIAGEKFILVGEAAGMVKVLNFGGIATALESGRIAANTLFTGMDNSDIESRYRENLSQSELMNSVTWQRIKRKNKSNLRDDDLEKAFKEDVEFEEQGILSWFIRRAF